ncbi:MAG: universal stress protein [Dokdonella sp.]
MSPVELTIHLRRCGVEGSAARVGMSLAQSLRAHVVGLHTITVSPATFTSPEAVSLQVQESDDLYQDALAQAPWWMQQLAAHGLTGEWKVTQGDAVEALCHASRSSDFLVIERPQLKPDAPTGWGLASRTVFGASAPVVVVPDTTTQASCGQRVVIAWNGSREATLAIRGALPVLAQAAQVHVLEGEQIVSPFGVRHWPPFDLRALLQRHDVTACFAEFRPERDRGAAILDQARAFDADLIVMGAWGQSRITEWVLGGATRHLLQHSDIPLLVAH